MADKTAIIGNLKDLLQKRIAEMEEEVKAAILSRDTATKSSAGDKHETARAMLQAEIDKASQQLAKTRKMLSELNSLPSQTGTVIGLGSLVQSANDLYFISVPFGKVEVKGIPVFCISMASPIAQALAAKKAGDNIAFMDREIEIKKSFLSSGLACLRKSINRNNSSKLEFVLD